MRQSQSQANTLLIVVAVLAVIGGLAIVAVTSPQSFSLAGLAGLLGGASATPGLTVTIAPTATPTEAEPTATILATATRRPTLSAPLVTSTLSASPTPEASLTPGPTEIVLPAGAVALAEVRVQQAENGRVRNAPNGDEIVAIVPNGTLLYVLEGRQTIDTVVWMEVRLMDGDTGWMADFLLTIIYSEEP